MSPMRLIILLVAAAAAAGAAFLVRNMAQVPTPNLPSEVIAPVTVTEVVEVPQTPVLVLTRDVQIGDLIYPGDLTWRDWPNETLNANYFTADIFPNAMDELTNSVVRTAMVENEPLLPQKIVQKGDTGYMAALLAPGMRAVAVQISTDNASGGFILPGDRVDVMITYELELEVDGEMVTRPTTTTILENVRVLAIDQSFSEGEGGQFALGSTATVELGPDQARLIVLAETLGGVSLALRSLRDAVEGGPTLARTDFLIDLAPLDAITDEQVEEVTIHRAGASETLQPQGS